MKSFFVVILVIVIANGFVSAKAEISEECAGEASLDSLDVTLRLFFTMPSETEILSLDLWYADSTGVYPTSHEFTDEDRLILSPDGDYIFVGRTKFMGSAVSAPYGTPGRQFGAISFYDILVIETDNFTISRLNLPEWFYEIRFIEYPTVWIDGQTLLFVTIWEGVQTVRMNIHTEEVIIEEWPAADAFLPYPSGHVIPSPNGEYLFYTTDVVALNNSYSPFYDRSWRILNKEGDIIVDYIPGTVGDSAIWQPDSSGVVLNDQQMNLFYAGLDGDVTSLYEYDEVNLLTHGLPDTTGLRIAFEASVAGIRDFNSLVILDTITDQIIDYCQRAIRIQLGGWSRDRRFLAYTLLNTNLTQLSILDTVAQTKIEFTPFQPESGIVSSRFVRILGWQYINN